MPLFSVILPTFNRAALITEALTSVFAQDCHDFEIFVVDDGSTDDTSDRMRPLLDRVTVLRQQNRGPGAARNLGASVAQGEYLAFLDSDDLWFPWALATYEQIINECGRPSLIAGSMVYFHDRGEIAALKREPDRSVRFPDFLSASAHGVYCGSCKMVVRRDVFLAAGGFFEENINAEDHDFTLRIGTSPGFVNVTSPQLIGYRQHPVALTNNLAKTVAGAYRLIEMEREDRYPGGRSRRRDRRCALTQHTRPLSLALLRSGNWKQASQLYRDTFFWNLSLGRLRYLLGFPGEALLARGRSK